MLREACSLLVLCCRFGTGGRFGEGVYVLACGGSAPEERVLSVLLCAWPASVEVSSGRCGWRNSTVDESSEVVDTSCSGPKNPTKYVHT